jgi:hypothetical protein
MKCFLARAILNLLLLIGCGGTALATNVSGNVSGTWTAANSPYHVIGHVTIPTGQTLEIQPGVHVLFTGHFRFTVNGNLQAIGTEEDSIIFTRAYPTEASKWWGIRFTNAPSTCLMDYCVIEYARKEEGNDIDCNGGGIHCYNSIPTITHCTIQHNWASRGGGILSFTPPSMPITISHCLITDNYSLTMGGGIWIQNGSTVTKTTIANNVNGNTYNEGASIYNSCIFAWSDSGSSQNSHFLYCAFYHSNGGSDSAFGELTTVNANGDSCDQYHNIFNDPLFVDRTAGDYHLTSVSHCIDAGDPDLARDRDGSVTEIGVFPATWRGLHVVNPNGHDVWNVSQIDTIRWTGLGIDTVRIELNRSYPGGLWETISDRTPNDGEYLWVVTEPVSSHSRIRITALNDTLADISDDDFNILPYVNLITPNGGEEWELSEPHTIVWACAGAASVRIEINRQSLFGRWETLRDTTANDTFETFVIPGPPSNYCRIRVTSIGIQSSDTSEADFSLATADGYLALVQSVNPYVATTVWNVGLVDSLVVSPWYRLRNSGGATIHVSPPAEPASAEFSRSATCNTYFTLVPGQMSACSLRLTFDPLAEGIYRDTLRIQTDAANAVNDSVRIPLSGALLSPPQIPQIAIRSIGNDILLTWRPVTQTIHGTPIIVSTYLVFCSTTPQGYFQYLGSTLGTSYIDASAVSNIPTRYYQVVAVLGGVDLVESLPGGGRLSKEEVLSRLRRAVSE